MPDRFIITGYPRSRIRWLANFLTYGPCFCVQNGMQLGFDGLESEMVEIEKDPAIQHVGNADSSALIVPIGHALKFHKIVLINRLRVECERSFMRHFCSNQNNLELVSFSVLKTAFDRYEEGVKRIKDNIAPNFLFEIQYADLFTKDGCSNLWFHIAPEYPFPSRRFDLLNKLSVNPFFRK